MIVCVGVRLEMYSRVVLLTVQRDCFARAIFGSERLMTTGHFFVPANKKLMC